MKKPNRWPCVFAEPIVRDKIDPKVKAEWERGFGVPAPFGDLRRSFKRHCEAINPYGSEDCPYSVADCAYAFLDDVEETVEARPYNPGGYFRVLTRSTGARRADERPLARDRLRRTDVPQTPTQAPRHQTGDAAGPRAGGDAAGSQGAGESRPVAGPVVHRTVRGWSRTGSLFGPFDDSTREDRGRERSEDSS